MFSGLLLAGQANNSADSSHLEKEAALGKQLAANFRQHDTPIDSAAVQDYLDRLVLRIATQVPNAEFLFTVSAIQGDPCQSTHEATAYPGGYLFVPVALFLAAQDEAEFAGMLAQAMERIAMHFGRLQAAQLAKIPLIFMGGGCSEGQMIPIVRRQSDPRAAHAAVLEADAMAVQTMARTGFDPAALARYIERVQPNAAFTVYTALPDRDQRVAAMRSAIERLPQSNYAAHDEEFAAIQQEMRRLTEHPATVAHPPTLKRNEPQ